MHTCPYTSGHWSTHVDFHQSPVYNLKANITDHIVTIIIMIMIRLTKRPHKRDWRCVAPLPQLGPQVPFVILPDDYHQHEEDNDDHANYGDAIYAAFAAADEDDEADEWLWWWKAWRWYSKWEWWELAKLTTGFLKTSTLVPLDIGSPDPTLYVVTIIDDNDKSDTNDDDGDVDDNDKSENDDDDDMGF